MSVYGIQLIDGARQLTLTPDINQIISAGRVTLPSSLNGDGTYGTDISLGGTYAESQLTVIITPVTTNYSDSYTRFIDGSTLYFTTHYATSAYTYYTRNSSTGVMSVWSAGNRTVGTRSTWNPIVCATPVCFWDKMGASSFSSIRLFGATSYMVQEHSNITNQSLNGTVTPYTAGDAEVDNFEACIDNNEATFAGSHAFDAGSEASFTVNLNGAYCVNAVQLLFSLSTVSSGCYYTISIYNENSWQTIYTLNPIPNMSISYFLNTIRGVWKSVTNIKVRIVSYGGLVSMGVHEFRCFSSTAPTDKLVYSIGSSGVATVDYMVALRKYDS